MKPFFTNAHVRIFLITVLLSVFAKSGFAQQLGIYQFASAIGSCPNTNNTVTLQPLNATFSAFTNVGGTCVASASSFNNLNWNIGSSVNLNQYNQFTITAGSGFGLNLTSLVFSHLYNHNNTATWVLRSSLDNYTSNISSGSASTLLQTATINLSSPAFSYLASITFRLYLYNAFNINSTWSNDDVTLNGSVVPVPATPGTPTSNSPQCSNPGVTISAPGTPPLGVSWYWQTSATGTSTYSSGSTYIMSTAGPCYLRAQDNTTLAWSTGAGSVSVSITPGVGVPVFLSASSTRCQGGGTITYNASATNSTGITYNLDAASISGNNSIDAVTGIVTFDPSWTAPVTVSANAAGCSGPTVTNFTVNTVLPVTPPVFTLGLSSTRCQGSANVTYAATASNSSGITYSLDANSLAFSGNSINSATGVVTYAAGWTGTSTITASASGCSGPQSSVHTATITPGVGTPVFTLGTSSTRCQGAGTINYSATATTSTGVTYSLNTSSLSAGNTINSSNGDVTYVSTYSGTTIITASAAGCNGPALSTHTVTINPTVGNPVFAMGATSSRCQLAGTVTYLATASTSTSISYSLDATTIAAGNSISSVTGVVTFVATWIGTSVITATANGCNGPSTSTHTVTTTPVVSGLAFDLGGFSNRCQGVGTVTYNATAANATGIMYTLDLASRNAGNTINGASGTVTYVATWSGTSTITANAAGCSPQTGSHVVSVIATVGSPVFTIGNTSSRCQGAGNVTYTASATTSTGITYSLDAASISGNNIIDSTTGVVTYDAAWTGASTIAATATGCNGPKSSTHISTTSGPVATPVFSLGATSVRCQGGGNVAYSATATNSTGITYTLDATTSTFAGNSINSSTGVVTYGNGWSGTSTITATASGCFGPISAMHTVTITPTVGTPVFTNGSSLTRCQGAGVVNCGATATTTTGITYSLNGPSITAGNSINSSTGDVTFVAGYSGTTTVTATAAGCNGPKHSNCTITVTATVGVPVFNLGASSTRCQSAATVNYTATASTNTGISYTLDGASLAAGNSINSATGAVTYTAGWSGTSTITAIATGCNGPATANHIVTITPTVSGLAFSAGGSSTRCQGSGTVTYNATANNTTGITYTLDAPSISGGNSIVATTGLVTYSANWSGTSTVTATAAGCSPLVTTHVITITPTVGNPVFTLGSSSTRCQGAGSVTYSASASTNTGISYSLDNTSLSAGNSINSASGIVTYTAAWSGMSTITVTATGCNGPKSASHTVATTATVGTPIFAAGASSVRCQGAGSVTYSATATATTGITYTLDAPSISGGNLINATTGVVTYSANWSGTSYITATAAGCSGPATSTHTATITPTVSTPVFSAGTASTRCQAPGLVNYAAMSTTSTGMTYSLDAASLSGGNSINSATGDVTFIASWSGTAIITVNSSGCNGPKSATHTVNTTATVGQPVFTMGATSARAQSATTVTYSASASTTTGITYTLDASSLAGGNTINSSTGAVAYSATWAGSSTITASAAGCSGPTSSTHLVRTNPKMVTTSLYLSDPSQALDRIDPVSTNDLTTTTTVSINSGQSTTFTQGTALCSQLVIKQGTITVLTYVTISGTIPAVPAVTATLRFGATNIIVLTNPAYNSVAGTFTWTGTLAADDTIPGGSAIALDIASLQAGGSFKINYDSKTKPSKIDLPVSTYANISSFKIYNAPYPGGNVRNTTLPGVNNYLRAVASSPFGAADITGLDITITPTGVSNASNLVGSSGCSNTYEYLWNTPATSGTYSIAAAAHQGFENTISYWQSINSVVCSVCAPVAVDDSSSGAGGAPLIIDVLANDYDPNNNINPASLILVSQPANGDAVLSNNKIVYIPNGTFTGVDQFTYQICDSTSPTPLCSVATVKVKIDPTLVDPCSDATKSHVFYLPYPEQDARTALLASQNAGVTIDSIRTIISLKMPYTGMTVIWDHWEDGYEVNPLNPVQSTTQVWGDGNPYNGIAPGYPDDIIPAGGSIVLDNTIPSNPRVSTKLYYDGRDKIISSGQISVTQVSGEPTIIGLQCMKTDVAATNDFGKSFTIPVGTDFPSQDFAYTALFIRAAQDSTTINIDKDNDGIFETTQVLNEGQSFLVNGGVKTGAKVTSSAPIGIDLHMGGLDSYSSREVPIFPASWYSHTYYSPVPTTGSSTAIKDTNAVYLYNSLNRPITINWTSGLPSNGSIVLPAKTVKRFALSLSQTAAYKFDNPTGESFTAIQICDSYTPGGGGNSGSTYDWAFNLIAEERLTSFATTAWAPGSTDGTRNDNPIWVTPSANTTIYVKYDGNLTSGGSVSPLGLHYDVSYALNALDHKRIKDPVDKDQGGLAVFTCDGTKLAAVYGEDPSTANTGSPSWDVGTTIRPFCGLKLIFANDDYAFTLTDNPVTIPILRNDYGFSAVVDPTSVNMTGLLQPKHGTVIINSNGTLLYTPNPGYQGMDTLQYSVCSTPSPIVCDDAYVFIKITSCPTPASRNIIAGKVFMDTNRDGLNNDGGAGFTPAKVYLYIDGNCNSTIDMNELADSVSVDSSGTYQFIRYPEKTISDNFAGQGGTSSCANGTDGNTPWLSDWVDAGDPSVGFCVSPAQTIINTKAEIVKDGAFGYAMRLKGKNVSATRTVNLSGATYAFLTFSYRRASATLIANHNIIVQVSTNGTTFNPMYTIQGDGTTDASYVTIYNQDITAYASGTTYIRFLTNANVGDADSVFIDNVSVKYLTFPQCYITKLLPASIPSNYYITTPVQKSISVSGTGSCFSPYDFGVSPLYVLPLEQMPLTGLAHQNENWLYWSTETETNSDHFEIEGSTDGTSFISIGSVIAKSGSTVKSYYTFIHQSPPKGINYYRVKLVNRDGRISYTNTISLKPGSEPIQMTVMPNPFTNNITAAVNFSAPGKATLSITDMYGHIVRTMSCPVIQGFNSISVTNLETLTSGTYLIQIKNQEQVAFAKIVKVK